MELLVVRHGQTDWNLLHKAQGQTDIELNETGIEQAYEISNKLKNTDIDLIISSPLKRAMQTANIIRSNRNISILIDARIIERNFGELEGLSADEIDFASLWDCDKDCIIERGESIKDMFSRVYLFLDEILKKYKDKRILLVTHGGVSMVINSYFNGIPANKNIFNLMIGNCEVVKFSK